MRSKVILGIGLLLLASTAHADMFIGGGGGGGDADTLDTLDSTQFLRSDASDSYTSGTLTFDATTTLDVDGSTALALPLTLANSELIQNSTDDMVEFIGAGGSDNTDLRIDLDGAYPVLTSPTDSAIQVAEDFIVDGKVDIGGTVSGAAYNVIADASTASSAIIDSDDDLYIEGSLEVGQSTVLNKIAYTWPSADGSSLQVLHTDGSGSLTWDDDDTGAGGGDPVLIDGTAVSDAAGVDIQSGAGIAITFNAGVSPDTASIAIDATGDWTGTLDSIEGASFLRSDASDSYTSGTLTTASTTILDLDGSTTFALPLTFANAEYLTNASDGFVSFVGIGGDPTDLRIDLDWTYPVLDSQTDSAIGFGEDVVIVQKVDIGGTVSGVAYNVIADASTSSRAELNSDDDLYIEGNLNVGGTVSAGTVEIAADSITHAQMADADQADTKCLWFENPTATDDFKSIWANKTANDFLLTEIWAESDQTVTFMLQVDDGTPADVDSVDLAPAAGEAEDTSLNGDTTVAAGEELDLAITSVANTPTWVSICWTGNWVD